VVYTIGLSLILAILWLLLSGHFTPLLLGLGVVSIALTVGIARRMQILDGEAVPLHLVTRALRYWPWLVWEIVKANIEVVRIIIDPRLPISPTLVKVKASQRNELGRAIYANSITLTPGTVSMDMDGDTITVHALTRAGAESLEEGDMDRRVSRLNGDGEEKR